ncbi:hypothetical protein SLS60_002927 [Paraconiothyrium brasiliense]|uniref:Uncharacterized protein n=1 Tax=Paraconiothyrium brasiliense TaxID=300254 RepID=A0ABR3RU78_9PLEO
MVRDVVYFEAEIAMLATLVAVGGRGAGENVGEGGVKFGLVKCGRGDAEAYEGDEGKEDGQHHDVK